METMPIPSASRRRRPALPCLVLLLIALLVALGGPPTIARAQVGQLHVTAGGPYSGTAGVPVTLAAQADVGGVLPNFVVQFQWNFGDGTGGLGQVVTHVYAAAGIYSVSVVAVGNGQTASNVTSAIISGGAQTGQVTVNAGGPYTGQVGLPVTFSAQVGFGGQVPGTPVQVTWNFGDGSTGVGQSVSHVYAAAGTYTVVVSATVVSGSGGTATATTAAVITGAGQTGSGLSAGGPYTAQVGQLITMTGSLATATAGVIEWLWNFGDGTTGSGQTVQKAYTAPGAYTVTLQVRATNLAPLAATTTATIGGSPATGATEQIQLFAGCNNVALTWPSGTAITVVVSALSPSGVLLGIWRFDNVAQRFSGYSPLPGAPSDLTTAGRADPVFICVNGPATLTRPVI